ncbi:MAG: hypothetical protein J6M05_01535 [Cardiobacteriaceae bacterium]|nr:hypothetical protein [Cardiobacteriaceae bacterium]
MSNKIIYQPKAVKQLRKIPENSLIRRKIEELKEFPNCRNVKSLVIVVSIQNKTRQRAEDSMPNTARRS